MSLFNIKYPKLSYDVDFNVLMFNNLPIKYRRIKIFKYISVIMESINTSYKTFLNDRDIYIKNQNVNGQTIVLEAFLQDYYQNVGIYIQNSGSLAETKYLFTPDETPQEIDEVNLFDEVEFDEQVIESRKTYLFSESEIESGVDFTVFVPFSVLSYTPISQIEGLVDRYKYLSTIYNVIGY